MLRTIIAKFNSKCASTGNRILKGDTIKWDSNTRKVYCMQNAPTDNQERNYDNQERNYEDAVLGSSDDQYTALYHGSHWSENYR